MPGAVGGRVMATEEGQAAISAIQAILNGDLNTSISGLIQQGTKLSDPSVWDGGNAGKFRADWPNIQGALKNVQGQLAQLQSDLQLAHTKIMHAGGNTGQ